MGISKTDTPITTLSTSNLSMELGETLTITATLNPSTFIALRSKTNSEVTIRVSTPPCSPIISPSSKRSPRVPSCKLSPLITSKSSTKTVDIDSIQLEKINLKGWVMLSTPQTLLWSIAWICATSSPSPRICVMMECEALTQNSTPYHYEDITRIVELGSLSNGDSMDVEEPVRFEITTNTNQYKIVSNSFMTPQMRNLMECLNPIQSAEGKSSATFLPADSLQQLNTTPLPACDSPPRACTPIPVSIIISKSTKQDKSVKDNKINRINKLLRKSSSKKINTTQEKPDTKPHPPPLVRTNTPFPERTPIQPSIISKRLKTRSISLEAVPVAPIVKPAPRPISFNVFEHIQKNSDIPVRKDTPQRVRVADKGSCLEFPISRKQVNTIVSILTNCEPSLRTSTTIAGDSDFSDNDDGASDFSEESDWDNSKVFQASLEQMQGEINSFDVDGEVLDLCERSKGLSPVLNYGPFCNKNDGDNDDDDDNSSCFSEDVSDSNSSQGDEAATTLDEIDEFSTENNSEDSATSSVLGSPFFDPAVLTSESDLGSWQKAVKAEKDIRKSLKLEKEERKRKEKEAKQLARMSRKLQKKQNEEEKANNRKSIKEETTSRKSLKLSEGIAGSRLSLRLKGCVRKIFGRMGISDDTSK